MLKFTLQVETKYIFVTNGVDTSCGKGVISSSLALLLLSRGFKVTILKFDPCINLDCGALNQYEYGECYVTVDGYEGDMVLGLYERFANIKTTRANHITFGRLFQNVSNKACRGEYQGNLVQMVPHITDEIKRNVLALGFTGKYDFVVIEIGGKEGDMETLPFIEAIRQFNLSQEQNCACVSVSSVSASCDVSEPHEEDIYKMPLKLREQRLDEEVLRQTETPYVGEPNLMLWNNFLEHLHKATEVVNIGLVGKLGEAQDTYRSIKDALMCAMVYHERKLNLLFINSENLNDGNVEEALENLEGVIIAPGFGTQGVEGKLVACRWCREHDKPTLGIGQGMQSMVVEFARNVLGFAEANSAEVDAHTPCNVIDLMEEEKKKAYIGGTLRLGEYRCVFAEGSLVAKAYRTNFADERHRHRFELNNVYRELFDAAGLRCVGVNPDTNLVDVVELEGNAWYMGVQYHPEYNSTVLFPNPVFMDFVRAVIEKKEIN